VGAEVPTLVRKPSTQKLAKPGALGRFHAALHTKFLLRVDFQYIERQDISRSACAAILLHHYRSVGERSAS